MLVQFSDGLARKHFVLLVVILMSMSPLTLCSKVSLVSGQTFEAGIKPGDWIEYEFDWAESPPPPYEIKIRRNILEVNGSSMTVRITKEMSDGSEEDYTQEGDIVEGTGAAAAIFIPPDLGPGSSVNIEGFDPAVIEGTTTRTYLGVRRTVVWANFGSDKGMDFLVYWDKEKGVALEMNHSRYGVMGTTIITGTNLWETNGDGEDDNSFSQIATLLAVIFIFLIGFMVWRRKTSSKRKRHASGRRSSRSRHVKTVRLSFCSRCLFIFLEENQLVISLL